MPNQTPKTPSLASSQNLLPFIEYFNKNRIEWKVIASQYDIPERIADEECWLPAVNVMRFLQKLVVSQKEHIGIEVGRLISLSQLSPALSDALDACDSIDDGVHVLMAWMPLLSNHVVVWPEKFGDQWMLCHRSAYRPTSPGFDQTEWFRTLVLGAFCRRFVDENWLPNHVWMSINPPPKDQLPASFLQLDIRYQQPIAAIELPVSEGFHAVEDRELSEHWMESMTKLASTYACLPNFHVDWLAKMVGMSTRTLLRRLSDNGITMRELRDTAREQTAKKLLKDQSLSMLDIAWHCGYTDLANFNRAFKKWTGFTAPQYRQQQMLMSASTA
ncbi:hypothetical protein A1OO_10920 [Enterovibrio norvegicus FF-33]|uniref:HTH araC/xylS-type domain-containing protein n=1 Tax=Enterovibrio norvegicus FF-454 TaxID=1185651 RepID=A0A1E5C7T3_9GAMM|nr:AraC family transcriptional regulator [Enterovibrio norvegicus]OEE61594.1 hypothetical protein A1OK_09555 [Enterovibrio norvegicus FF-454]OEE66294.1 hypothetical protein A1OO_10920 [Enterovibrio norvegicus FF-33]